MQIILLVFGLGVGFGAVPAWKLTADHYKAVQVAQVEEALAIQQQQMQLAFAAEKQAIDANHTEELKNNVVVKEIVKTIPKIQRVNSRCNYSVGTVRLLRNAAVDALPKAATVPAADDTARSGVTGQRGIEYSLALLKSYNLARNQCNALIQFVSQGR